MTYPLCMNGSTMATGRVPLPAFLTTALSTATLCAAALCTTALCTIALSLPAQAQDALAGIVSPLVGEKSADQIIPDLPFDAIPPSTIPYSSPVRPGR